MKTKIKFLLFIFCLSASINLFSQLRIGMWGGMIYSNPKYVSKNKSLKLQPLMSYDLGVGVDYRFSKYCSVNSGIIMGFKGFILPDTANGPTNTIKPLYLDIPIQFTGRYKFKKGLTLFASLGPYFSQGIGGEKNYESVNTDREEKLSFKYQSKDFGAAATFGIELRGFVISTDYYYGFVNTNNIDKIKEMYFRTVYVNLGFLIIAQKDRSKRKHDFD